MLKKKAVLNIRLSAYRHDCAHPFWWAVSLLIWTGAGAYVLACKVNAAPCMHALLAVAPVSALCVAASLDDGALIPLVVVMLIGATAGAFIAARRRAL